MRRPLPRPVRSTRSIRVIAPDRSARFRSRRRSTRTPRGRHSKPTWRTCSQLNIGLLDAGRVAPLSPAQLADAEQELGPHEDLERQPDGIPHLVIGLTALFSVALAAVLISMFRSGPTLGSIASVVIAIVSIPVLVSRLGAKAERDRDHDHPSR